MVMQGLVSAGGMKYIVLFYVLLFNRFIGKRKIRPSIEKKESPRGTGRHLQSCTFNSSEGLLCKSILLPFQDTGTAVCFARSAD